MSLPALTGIAVGTLISEDLATVAAGGLVRAGYVSQGQATLACVAGVYLGDQALWLTGRLFGRSLLSHRYVRPRVNDATVARLCDELDRHLGTVVLASRFLPGSRLPMYVAAGVWGRRPVAFAAWSLLAVLLWTPLLLWAALALGDVVATVLVQEATSVVQRAAAMVVALLALRFSARALRAHHGRLRA